MEGEASIGNQELSSNSVGSIQLQAGQSLTTQAGQLEVLLVPGTFLRVADNSSVKMVSSGLADTEVEIDKGRAMVEATDINKNNDIHARKYEDDFFRWSALRSGYLSEVSVDHARIYVNGGPGWFGPGWYWDPWFSCYTFIPGAGVFYSPFGWAFYSPFSVYRTPFFYASYWDRPHGFGDYHYPYGHGIEPHGGFRSPVGGEADSMEEDLAEAVVNRVKSAHSLTPLS